ncbi:MAG: hypothetical protein IT336_00020 [Thermomicrobiales bacterium]|nr:hypothetical protein [Thermomicrobiales bacterium]
MAASRGSLQRAGARPSTLSFAPDNQAHLQRGIATLEHALGPTLGPAGRHVACARIGRPGQPPELLDDGSTIARRMTGLPDRFGNMGFMMARHAAWRMRTEQRDGAATAVLILAAAHRDLTRLQGAGFNRVELEQGIERFLDAAVAEIARMAVPLDPAHLTPYAARLAGDPALAAVAGEALAVLGPDATIVTRASTNRDITVEYIEGALWESTAIMAPLLAADPRRRVRLDRPRTLLWDGDIADPAAFAAALDRLIQAGTRDLVVVARSFSREALALLHRNSDSPMRIQPVIAPHDGERQGWAFGDLAALTGGKRLAPEAGDTLARVTVADAGSAARVTIGARFLNVMALPERTPAIDDRIAGARRQMDATDDEQEWSHHQLRLGRLRQGFGVIWVGGATETERDHLLVATERCLHAIRNARTGGVVAGGGKALIEIAGRIRERCPGAGVAAAASACEAPARWLARNAGLDAGWAVAQARAAEPGSGIDVTTGRLVDLHAAGIVDAAATLQCALRVGLTTARLASDCGTLVHRPISLSMAEIRP